MEGIQRMLVIVNKLKDCRTCVPQEELKRHVARCMEARGYAAVDVRTLQRDFKEIAELFGIEIASDKVRGGYYIKEQDSRLAERYEQLLLNFDLLNALAADSDLASHVLAEHHRPLHSEWLAPLIGAIKGCHPVAFQYVLVRHDDEVAEKRVQPYFLKESNQRWYLLAYEGETLKTFGVDRIQQLQVLEGERFKRDREVDVDALKEWLAANPDSRYFCDGTGMGTLQEELAGIGNVVFTPVTAGSSVQSTERLSRKVIANIEAFLGGN